MSGAESEERDAATPADPTAPNSAPDAAPDPEVAGPPVQPIEIGLAVLLVLLGLYAVIRKLIPDGAAAPPSPDDSLPRLYEQMQAGEAKAISAALILFGLTSLTSVIVFLPRGLRALRAALRRRAQGAPTLGTALLLFGVAILVQAGVGFSDRQRPALVVAGAETFVPPGGALKLMTAGEQVVLAADPPKTQDPAPPPGAKVRAALRWGMGSGRLEVHTGSAATAVRLNDAPVIDGTTRDVLPGDRIAIGAFEARAKAEPLRLLLLRGIGAGFLSLVVLLLVLHRLSSVLQRLHPGAPPPRTRLLERVGWTSAGWAREVGRGAAGFFAFVPIYLGLVWLTQLLAAKFGLGIESHSLVRGLERDPSLAVLVVVQAALIAPLLEELLYRGIGQPAFERCLGAGGAILATALLFAVVHEGFSSLLPMFGLGVLFASLRLLSPTGSLVAPITAHVLFNGTTLALVLAIQAAGP